jgi:hypothetical protein
LRVNLYGGETCSTKAATKTEASGGSSESSSRGG